MNPNKLIGMALFAVEFGQCPECRSVLVRSIDEIGDVLYTCSGCSFKTMMSPEFEHDIKAVV